MYKRVYNNKTEYMYILFIRSFEKLDVLWEHMRLAGSIQSICPLNNLNSFHCVIIKLCENVCQQNVSAKFDNQPDPMKHFGVMVLELAKIAKINLVRSVT